MELFEYITLMREMYTPTAIAGVAILGVFLIIIILKMLGGMHRGGWRQLVRTGVTLFAAMVSYFVAVGLSNRIIGSIKVNELEALILEIEARLPELAALIRQALEGVNPEIVEYLLLLPATIVIVPLLATVIFLLINLLLKIARAIIIKVMEFKRAKNNTQRLCGAVLGALEALIWITMVLLPLCAILTLADTAYTEAVDNAEGEDKVALSEVYDEYFIPFTKNPAISFVRTLGADVMADGIATVRIDGKPTNMRDEVLSWAHLVIAEARGLRGADLASLSAENKEAIDAIIDALSRSPYMSHLLVGAVQSASSVISSDLIPVDFGGEYRHLLDELVLFLGSVDLESLGGDLNTVKGLYFTLSDSGILSEIMAGNSDIMGLLDQRREAGDDVLASIIEILKGNSRTNSLLTSITKTLISSISTSVTINGVEVEVSYESVKESVNEVLSVKREDFTTDEAYKTVLTATLDKALTDNGIELEEEIVNGIADHIDENYSDFVGELTDEEFNDILLEYFDAYLDYVNSGDLPEGVTE